MNIYVIVKAKANVIVNVGVNATQIMHELGVTMQESISEVLALNRDDTQVALRRICNICPNASSERVTCEYTRKET